MSARLLAACVALRFQVSVTLLSTAFPRAPAKFQFLVRSLRALGSGTPEKAGSGRCVLRRFLRHRAAVTRKAAIKYLVFIIHETKARTG